jgi:hypothetical protein
MVNSKRTFQEEQRTQENGKIDVSFICSHPDHHSTCYNIRLSSMSDFYNIGHFLSRIMIDSMMMAF